MLSNYIKSAWRSIIRQKVTSVINILGLAIGMWAAILIFIWVQNELSFDKHHIDAEDIYLVKNYLGTDQEISTIWDNSPYRLGLSAKEQIPEIKDVTRINPIRYQEIYFNINGEYSKETNGAYVDSNWFDMFKPVLLSGSIKAFNENPFSIVLTDTKAKKYFSNANPIGKFIQIDTIQYTVQAVIKAPPANTSFQAEFYFPVASRFTTEAGKKDQLTWGNYNYLTFFKFYPNTNLKKAEQKLTALILKERNREKNDMRIGLIGLPELHFDKSVDSPALLRGDKKTIAVFSILGILLLTIACINYINLTTAHATLRIKEVSVRKIVGAEKKHLFAQFITESFLVSFLALVLAIGGIYIGLPFFNSLTEKSFSLTSYASPIWLIAFGIFILSILLSSVYPAFLLASFKPIAIFSGRTIFSWRSLSLRKILVTAQFSLSVVLIIAAIVVFKQMSFINQHVSIANNDQFFSFRLPFSVFREHKRDELPVFFNRIAQELKSNSAIEEVSRMNGSSFVNFTGWSSGANNDWDGRPEGFEPKIAFVDTDTSFRHILNLKLADGRWLGSGVADEHNYIVNETAVKELGIRKPAVGQRFTARGDTGVIVGVVKDFYYKKINEKTGPLVIVHEPAMATYYMVKAAKGRVDEAKAAAEKVWAALFPGKPFSYTFLNDEYESIYRAESKMFLLVKIFSALAIFISCLGLFGLAAFTAERRKKEIGVRKVIGASVTDIVSLVSKEFVALVAIAFVIASPIAWWAMNAWLQEFAYRIPISWWIFMVAGTVTVMIAVITLSYHAIKAAVANPVKSLRTE